MCRIGGPLRLIFETLLGVETMQSYWNGNGTLQEAADRMHEELVPREGKAETGAGEGLRSLGNL